MTDETLTDIQRKLESITRKWWFFVLFILLAFVPPYTSKSYDWMEGGFNWMESPTGQIILSALQNTMAITNISPLFQIIPVILVISLVFLGNKVARLVSIYGTISYVLFAFLQSTAITEKFGFGIAISNLVMILMAATFWAWEVIAVENDFTPQKQPTWKFWVVPLAFLAFWFPMNPETLMPDFNPIYFLTSRSGLYFCTMTPVYLAILTMYWPRVNMATLRVTSLVGVLIGFSTMLVFFVWFPTVFWWNGVMHIPLFTISIYGLALSLRKRPS